MKYARRSTAIAVLVLFAVSCASTPQAKQYQALATCDQLARSGAQAFGVFYAAHKAENPTLWADRYDKAAAAYASYQKIGNAAQDAIEAKGDLTVLLAAVNEALNQYLALLSTFGVKP